MKVSEELFFEQGIANVRLQQLADNSGISIGNLAYHFKNKEVIVEEVYSELLKELSALHSGDRVYDGLDGFDKYFSQMYKFQKENGFYLNNFWEIERTYPKIKRAWQRIINTMLLQLSKRITANVASGNIKKEEFPGGYDLLANTLLLCINYRIPQQILRSKPTQEKLFKSILWNLLQPYFMFRGKAEFRKIIAP